MPSFAALLLPITPTIGSVASDQSLVGQNSAAMEEAGLAFSAALSLVQFEAEDAAETTVSEAATNPPPVAHLAFNPHLLFAAPQQPKASIEATSISADALGQAQTVTASSLDAPALLPSDLTSPTTSGKTPITPAVATTQAESLPQPADHPVKAVSDLPSRATPIAPEQRETASVETPLTAPVKGLVADPVAAVETTSLDARPAAQATAPAVTTAAINLSAPAAQVEDRTPVIQAATMPEASPDTAEIPTTTVMEAKASPVSSATETAQAAERPAPHHKLTATQSDAVAPPANFGDFKSVTANVNPPAFMGARSNEQVQTASFNDALPVQIASASADVKAPLAAPAIAQGLKLDAQYNFNVITRLGPAEYQAAVPAPVVTADVTSANVALAQTQAVASTSLATPLMAQALGLAPIPVPVKDGSMSMTGEEVATTPLPKTASAEAVISTAPQSPIVEAGQAVRLPASIADGAFEQANLTKATASIEADLSPIDSASLDDATSNPAVQSAELTNPVPSNPAINSVFGKPDNPIINPQQLMDSSPAALTKDGTEAGQFQTAQLDLDAASGTAVNADLPSGLSKATIETTAQISAQILRKLEGRSTRFDMTLTPEGLGRVDVSLTVEADGQVSARLAFDNPAAAAELRGRVDELRRQLAEAGLNLSRDNLEFTDRNPQSGSGGGAFERGHNRRAFAGAARLNQEADLATAPMPALWAYPSSLTPDRVDVKV